VASGKGGVGKTTAAVNLALALLKRGARVGLMDGDIYGPNVPLMLGVSSEIRPSVDDQEKLIPIEAQGLKMISMGVLVPADQPMIWRGPMLHSAVTQFVQKVNWGELDFLLVDLPPGTGDVQLSLAQVVPLAGAVIVTTPQEVALMDVRKGVAMFRKTNVPILGVIENMTGEIFGHGGGRKAAEQFGVPFLGEIPLDKRVRENGDQGRPIVLSHPDSEAAQGFIQAAILIEQGFTQKA
jgi:ATP-binding protein involved in chromosome partitioning